MARIRSVNTEKQTGMQRLACRSLWLAITAPSLWRALFLITGARIHSCLSCRGHVLGGRWPVNPHGAENSTEKRGVGRHPVRQTPWTIA